MIRRDFRQALEAQHSVLLALWVIFACGILIYIAVAQIFLADKQLAISYAFAQTAKLFLWFLTFVDIVTLVWWKRRFLNKEAILGGVKRYKVLQALQDHKGESEERAALMVSSYVTGKVVAFALAEAVAIYGFALVLTSHYFIGQYILSIASGILLLLEFPSRRFLADLIAAVEEN
ncbi:MAG TPA: hypothetical protein VKH64_10255 [Candidatus Binatia bacterium]|nr:hypothetical protein [Candidatus Binatia bacterium]